MNEPPYRYRIGADENGLGPLLGPMLTTAVLAELSPEGQLKMARGTRGKMKLRLGDSKALVAHGDVALAEAWARVLVERLSGVKPTTVHELVAAISLDSHEELRAPCPSHVEHQCWGVGGDAFVAPDDLCKTVDKDLRRLEKNGITLRGLRAVVTCNKRLNRELDQGRSRFVVDLHAMERLVLALREGLPEDVCAVLGKVGGLRQYEPVFGPLNGRLCAVIEERKERSTYRFPGVGELSFVMDADASDLLVSMASLVGKYLREVLMARIVHHYRQVIPELPDASGYHDPVTKGFVEATRLVRKRAKVPADCFERRSLS